MSDLTKVTTGTSWGENLRHLRAQRGWKQRELAKKAKVSTWLISQTELGKHTPSLEARYKLARVFDVPMQLLFPGEPDRAAI